MADYPCDMHLARYQGPSTRAYLNLYQEERVVAFRASVCGDCLAELVTEWLARALHKDQDGRWIIPGDADTLECLWKARSEPVEALNGSKRW